MKQSFKIINLSAEAEYTIRQWLPHDLQAESVIFLPDACPGKSSLPTGTVVLTSQPNWRKFAVSDCGCGIGLWKSSVVRSAFSTAAWDRVAEKLLANKGRLGDLGSGNHFLDACESFDPNDPYIYFAIHTGSRNESGLVDDLVDRPAEFDAKFTQVVAWAADNRKAVAKIVSGEFGDLELVLDRPHNHFDTKSVPGKVIIRKGAVRLVPGELALIPSSMNGHMVLVRGTAAMDDILQSMSHGTGRVMSRGDSKEYVSLFDYEELRRQLYIPPAIPNESIRTEAPFCYRELDACLSLIGNYVTEVARLRPFAYIGQL